MLARIFAIFGLLLAFSAPALAEVKIATVDDGTWRSTRAFSR